MPYAIDIVRLATSAVLAGVQRHLGRKNLRQHPAGISRRDCKTPEALVLDREHQELRNKFVVSETSAQISG